jgi:hypothetical protein
MQEADHGDRRLLGTRNERPRSRRTTNQSNELAPPHARPPTLEGHRTRHCHRPLALGHVAAALGLRGGFPMVDH